MEDIEKEIMVLRQSDTQETFPHVKPKGSASNDSFILLRETAVESGANMCKPVCIIGVELVASGHYTVDR